MLLIIYAVVQLVEAVNYKLEGRGFNSWWGQSYFSLTESFRLHYGPGVDSAPNRNEYQRCLLVGKGSWCVWLTTLPPSCADCLEILEASTSSSPKGLSWDSFTFSLLTIGCTLSLVASDDKENTVICPILCFVDRASLYNLVNKANLVHNFS
jgi:hypothetical protein